MITDKLTVTHQFLEELAQHAGKAHFMPSDEIGQALQCLETQGIPNSKNESYKYCNIEAILRKNFKTISGKEQVVSFSEIKKQYAVQEAYNLFIVNGHICTDELEVSSAIKASPIQEISKEISAAHLAQYAKSNTDPMIALNAAYADRGFFLRISQTLDKPLIIHHINSLEGNLFFNTRNLFVIEKNTEAQITEFYYSSNENSFRNTVTEIFVDTQAHIQHVIAQNTGAHNYLFANTQVHQEKQSTYTNHTYTFSGALVRNNLKLDLNGEYTESHLYGLFITQQQQLVDNHTEVNHLKPNGQSNELYKGVVAEKSTAVFNGRIFVERHAQKTNAYQSSKNILLSNDAVVNAKPELEIYANDVKCSHGTSTGKVDENALFYLKARGIGEENARKLLLHAFAYEILEKLPTPFTKEKISTWVDEVLR
ncbi:MAG: Fe-S cluster assembly protein SufD [Bacteroidetes bacterium]|nr:Fe-S cluster assembly protein SufD [Bacteroidota bacterium]